MANKYLNQFPAKIAPVLADIIYVGDSANGFTEVKSTFGQFVTNNNVLLFSGSLISGDIGIFNGSNQIVDSAVNIDGSTNVTNVRSITLLQDPTTNLQVATKQYADTKLAISQDLGDLSSAPAARTNLGLGTAATKVASNNSEPNLASIIGTITPGDVVIFADSKGTITDGGSTSIFLKVVNNLDDVESPATSFNNISPTSTQGDIIIYSGGTNNRLPIGATNQVLSVNAGLPAWRDIGSVTSFSDNAIFTSNSQLTLSTSPQNLPAGVLYSSSPGSTWSTFGDNTGMVCGHAGGYWCVAQIPTLASGVAGGQTWFYITVNNIRQSPLFPLANLGNSSSNFVVITTATYGLLALNANDIVRIVGITAGSLNPLSTYYNPGVSDGLVINFIRLT
jgi:hypothetical protein